MPNENDTSFLIAQTVGSIAFAVFVAGSVYLLYVIIKDYINGKN